MGLKLYYDLWTQPSRSLYIFMKTAGIPFEEVCVNLRRNEHLQTSFSSVNPMGKIPVLTNSADGTTLLVRESCTIARFGVCIHVCAL